MHEKRTYFIVDDDRVFIRFLTKYLASDLLTIASSSTSSGALREIKRLKPDCLILDIMMPDIDGLELCTQVRADPGLDKTKIVIVSGKTYEIDRKRAFDTGADGYIAKPVAPDKIAGQIQRIVEDRVEMTFWGVRGTLPVPGQETIRYGGNTNCISLEFPKGSLFVFDAGTGIKSLSDHLENQKRSKIEAKIFISHPHWDHINALPFFTPLYKQGNEFDIMGPAHGDISIRELISGQMDGVYFPIEIKEFGATVCFQNLKEGLVSIDGMEVQTILLNHPGHCLGYRVEYKDRAICYITDNELFSKSSRFYNSDYIKKLTAFIRNTDALITDCTYTEDEYAQKIRWGHSSITEVVQLAHRAEVGTLYMYHHDPSQTDTDIDSKIHQAQALLNRLKSSTVCIAPKEKQQFMV
jgi:phosphoribosyl 1,2-cyclic phosphodiesterase/ActR/RegA family two-component response regulator